MKKEKPGTIASRIIRYFYTKKDWSPTSMQCIIAMRQVKSLLKVGFTEEQIYKAIDYTLDNPPMNGFNSIGWLNYNMNDILDKIKAKEVQEQINEKFIEVATEQMQILPDHKENEQKRSEQKKPKNDKYNFDIF